MSFVASRERLEFFRELSRNPSYSQEGISVEFTTTFEFIKSVVPPTFETADEPTGLISISTWESNVCGSYELSSVSVRCKVDGETGYYVLNLIVSEDVAITWGRESWGEIKKQGKPRLFRSGTRRRGYCERRGVRLIEMEADFDRDLASETSEWLSFEVKAFPGTLGSPSQGLHCDPILITLRVVDHNVKRATGKGRLVLRGTRSDPLHTIPVKSVGDFQYSSGPSEWRLKNERFLCPADAYLPYFVGRHYDDVADPMLGQACTLDRTHPQLASDPEVYKVQELTST
ncbi:acetoacetate decarboxylase-domain-containing protein [Exophiala viscosa]|uniref:Acetoacetate decarboxylase-domain-containing protein n=1 Tax=Exophiala viscosa TaxID=2486360 RepID=A0AAN6E4U1_9EURO|nr:acetoacetate decarboxylase-domain-containing protein [Exophiala viscosa]KAI1629308.1 acetoacetate decarboxylase-domain-containing protein [Exophiala viscosa]